jgi:hypothetical protein
MQRILSVVLDTGVPYDIAFTMSGTIYVLGGFALAFIGLCLMYHVLRKL